MSKPLVIVGCGGFGREVHDIVDAINLQGPAWDLQGYVDDAPSQLNAGLVRARGADVLGSVDWFDSAASGVSYVIGIADGAVRRRIAERLRAVGFGAATLVHPSVTMGFDVVLGAGSVVCSGVQLSNNIRLGEHVQLNPGSTIGHDARIADYVTVSPLVAISGGVRLGLEVMMGTHSAILQNLSVGARAVVGAGACVVKNVPPDTVVKGVPAR